MRGRADDVGSSAKERKMCEVVACISATATRESDE